jgi:hypothetical protein
MQYFGMSAIARFAALPFSTTPESRQMFPILVTVARPNLVLLWLQCLNNRSVAPLSVVNVIPDRLTHPCLRASFTHLTVPSV